MNFIFLVDNYPKWNIEKDTSFALMQGALKRNHRIFLLYEGGLSRRDGVSEMRVTEVQPQENPDTPFEIIQETTLHESDINIVFIRTDPPFDAAYLMQTWLLELLPSHIPIINNPRGIRTCNEKIWATQFPELMPPTMISRDQESLYQFLADHENVILKPTDGFGGLGITHIKNGETEAITKLSNNFQHEVILQKYLPEADKGDKRILLLNGEPIGAVLRLHGEEDFRNNFMAGGTPQKTTITEDEKKIASKLKPHLQALGLYFVGIDIIGPYLTEVNVTSPTCLKEINQLENLHLEEEVITFAEKLIDQSKVASKI